MEIVVAIETSESEESSLSRRCIFIVPFFLHYIYKDDLNRAMVFLFLMGWSHASFILFITPVILHMISKKDQRAVCLIAVSFLIFSNYTGYANMLMVLTGDMARNSLEIIL